MHTPNDQRQFGFERLEVWRFAMIALREIKALQVGKFGDLREQLHCAALSTAANLAEGRRAEARVPLACFRDPRQAKLGFAVSGRWEGEGAGASIVLPATKFPLPLREREGPIA